MARYGATVLCCTPTYALRLGSKSERHRVWSVGSFACGKSLLQGAGGSVPAVREKIARLWGRMFLIIME
jgi:phenylacetate-CoA ligase